MCEHHDCHNHVHTDENKFINPLVLRIIIALAVFAAVYIFNLSGAAKFFVFFISYIIAGGDVLLTALKNILKGEVFDENFLMSIATLGAFAIKEYPEAVMVMVLYQTGEYLQHGAVEKSRKSITELMDIRPDCAYIEQDGKIIQKSPGEVSIGDVIVVKTGEKIPLDGIVVEGKAAVDTSALTGEAVPKELKIGDNALSGCININGVIKIRVNKEFGDSTVSKIIELVEHAASKKAKAENFITRFAKLYTPAVVFGALLLAFFPPLVLGADFSLWFERALTFLVISCPCALVISVPLGFFAGIGGASKCGILVKGSCYLEALSKPDCVVFDKTGTLTKGTFKVTQIVPVRGTSQDELLEITALAETYSDHPIAVSLKTAYGKNIEHTNISDVSEIAGNGVKADINGNVVLAGNLKLMKKYNIDFADLKVSGTVVHTAVNGKYVGYIVISDEVKEDSFSAVKELKKLVKKTVMLTGDSIEAAKCTAEKLGIDKIYAGLLPSGKVEKIEDLILNKQKNKNVIYVGDGINDAPVLTRADVGIAMGALGSDAAIEAADIVIMDDKPSKIPSAVKIADKTMRIVKQNIFFALGVKALFLILGALGFITMWGAVFADVGVTLIAVINSLRALNIKCG